MFSFLGSYALLFSEGREEVKPVNAEVEESNIIEIVYQERKYFVASVCDAVCGNAPYLCKVAFCSVILNRCENPSFPNTPAEIVMQDQIFDRAHDLDYKKEPSQSSLMAYDDAINGFSPCPEALYYSTTETTDITLKTRLTLFKIGKYIFS